ncbi:hypothetical protein FDECE_12101 [Fusarium decemcellulare]|nr:hypothetical protein FDECE_12101 [Fusarium decemcellulare]
MRKSASSPAALGGRKWVASILSRGREDSIASPSLGIEDPGQDGKLSHVLKKTKAELLSRFVPRKDKKSWSKLTDDRQFTHANGTIEQVKEKKKSAWSTLFDTKSGKKLHKRAKSDPTPQVGHQLEVIDELLELPLIERVMGTDSIDIAAKKTVDEIFGESDALKGYAHSIKWELPEEQQAHEEDDAVSDTGTVIIRRPDQLDDLYEVSDEGDAAFSEATFGDNEPVTVEQAVMVEYAAPTERTQLKQFGELDPPNHTTPAPILPAPILLTPTISTPTPTSTEQPDFGNVGGLDLAVVTGPVGDFDSAISAPILTEEAQHQQVGELDTTVVAEHVQPEQADNVDLIASPEHHDFVVAELDKAESESKSTVQTAAAHDATPDDSDTAPSSLVSRAIQKGVWGLNKSSLIRKDPRRLRRKRRLPSCTSYKAKNWQITDSVLKTYTAMRGPYRLSGRDLFVWADRCRKALSKPAECSNEIGSCDTIMAGLEPLSIDPPPVEAESSGPEYFIVPRPPYEHIELPEGSNPSEYAESLVDGPRGPALRPGEQRAAQDDDDVSVDGYDDPLIYNKTRPANKQAYLDSQKNEFYVSDEEGTPSDSRISPCTFLLWAENCERWDSVKIDPEGINEQYRRHLEALERNKKRSLEEELPSLDSDKESQHSSLSYDLGPDPDYLPPRHVDEWHHELLERMNGKMPAVDDNKNADGSYDADGGESTASDYILPYTEEEIQEALNAEGARTVARIDPREAEQMLRRHHSIIRRCDAAELQAQNGITSARQRVDARASQLERVTASIKYLNDTKNRKSIRRRRAIYRHVSQHLRELQERVKVRHEETWEMSMELANLLSREKQLVDQLTEEAARIGLDGMNPNEIERAVQRLMDGETLEAVREPEDIDDIMF